VSSDPTGRRRQIEDATAARLAEIVAGAERAAKQVIDEAEAEARTRLEGAEEEAGRIVAERLAALGAMTDEMDAQAEALKRSASDLQRAIAEARAQLGGTEALGGSKSMGRGEAEPAERRPASPSLTVVGGAPAEPEEPVAPMIQEVRAAEAAEIGADFEGAPGEPGPEGIGTTPAGARLLATQMAVSGSSREEIAARLRSGFEITDTQAILDAILGPEH
jgi:vacuolar-type H+-ATPase subunit H